MSPDAIDKSLPIPYYYQLEQILREKIRNGQWEPGNMLPSESELCARFTVSRTVVRQALDKLCQDGILYKQKGRGTFVARPKLQERFIQRPYGFYQEMKEKGLQVRSRVIEQELVLPPAEVRNRMHLSPRARTVKLSRLRSVESEVIMLTVSYLRAELCPGLEHESLADRSLYELLKDKYHLAIAYGQRTLEAVSAGQGIARQLQVAAGAPLIYLESLSLNEEGTAIEFFHAWHRGDRCKFALELIPPERLAAVRIPDASATFWFQVGSKT